MSVTRDRPPYMGNGTRYMIASVASMASGSLCIQPLPVLCSLPPNGLAILLRGPSGHKRSVAYPP